MSIVVIARVRPAKGEEWRVREALLSAVPAVHAEDGCHLFSLHVSEGVLFLVEQWRDSAALREHSMGETFTRLMSELDGLLAGDMEVHVLKPIPAGESEKGVLRRS